jgi:hypothetical protein
MKKHVAAFTLLVVVVALATQVSLGQQGYGPQGAGGGPPGGGPQGMGAGAPGGGPGYDQGMQQPPQGYDQGPQGGGYDQGMQQPPQGYDQGMQQPPQGYDQGYQQPAQGGSNSTSATNGAPATPPADNPQTENSGNKEIAPKPQAYEYKSDESTGSSTAFEVFRSKTFVKNPLELRDPFKRKINKKKGMVQGKSKIPGLYQNIDTNIENKSVESIRIVGVLIGDERRALARIAKSNDSGGPKGPGGSGGKDGDGPVFYLKEGMRVGPNGAEVKAIVPGGVVLVEKIRNVYDQDEYLETVIPVSSD